jgi:hypothetical protein
MTAEMDAHGTKMDEITGLLYSQIGYDMGLPVRAIVRSTDEHCLSPEAHFELQNAVTGRVLHAGRMDHWGTLWGSHWWTADASEMDVEAVGRSAVRCRWLVYDGERLAFTSGLFTIGPHWLWDQTVRTVALDQMEERVRRARNEIGWMDCGSSIREANSHTTMVIGLCDLLKNGVLFLSQEDQNRLKTQIVHGCTYLSIMQDKAQRLGLGDGALVHEIPNGLRVVPGDAAQAVVAFAHASRLLSDWNPEKSDEYLRRAEKAFAYLHSEDPYYGPQGFSASNHGAPPDFVPPRQWMTHDLLMILWGAVELCLSGKWHYQEQAVGLAQAVMKRQVPEDRAEEGLFGHFYTFEGVKFTQKANVHHNVGHDTGAIFPYYVLPLIEMLRVWEDHEDAPAWRQTIEKFAYGYFLPACSRNPFYLLPEGVFPGEGLLSFCGPWHGINATYAFAAALACELEAFLLEPRFRKIITGNLQWIAGLHAGITQASLEGCVIWQAAIAPGTAQPYSQMWGIGEQYAGSWSSIPGSISNGFSADPQFQFSVSPTKENDLPRYFTDEDWIPHAAGWLSALSRLRTMQYYWRWG